MTGKFIALMTSGIPFLLRAIPDFTLVTMHKPIIRQAPLAADIIRSKVVTIGQNALAGDTSPVKLRQSFLEFLVVFTVGNMNGANATIQPAGRQKIRIYFHHIFTEPPLSVQLFERLSSKEIV